jgi:basic amino acid/polyamine antiporter, APA family
MAELSRRLGTGDAVVIGLGSMLGAGVFAAFGPAARAAGVGLLIGLVIAAAVAYCNATASAQLAAVYPTSGGTYIYGRERLGPWWGFAAGWGFVVGKTASCAAMALTIGTYAVPGPWWAQRLVAVAAVVGLTALNYRGVTKTAALARILVACTLVALATVVIAIVVASGQPSNLTGAGAWSSVTVYGVLQSAGLLFFAFAGYARIATMGEEVREPAHAIPRAIIVAFGIAVVVYLIVGVSALLAAGPERLARSAAPLAEALRAAGAAPLLPVVAVGATLAGLGALLALIAGIGRTTLAMARHRDLPGWLAAVHPRHRVPHRAEVALAAVVCILAATVDLRGVIGFSSFGVLIYYAIANASAYTQPAAQRRWPRVLNVCGVAGCLLLVATLPWPSVVVGLAVFAIGLAGRAIAQLSFTDPRRG